MVLFYVEFDNLGARERPVIAQRTLSAIGHMWIELFRAIDMVEDTSARRPILSRPRTCRQDPMPAADRPIHDATT